MAKDLESIFITQRHQEESSYLEMLDVETLSKALKFKAAELREKGYGCVVEESMDFETLNRYVMFLAQKENGQALLFKIKARSGSI